MAARQDLWAGLAIAGLGLAVAAHSGLNYDIGTPRRMGPGFFPVGLGLILAALGGATALQGAAAVRSAPPAGEAPHVAWRELASVLGAIAVFALGLERLGLVPTTLAAVLLASVAAPRRGVVWRLALALAITLIAVLVFAVGLSMALPLWPGRGA